VTWEIKSAGHIGVESQRGVVTRLTGAHSAAALGGPKNVHRKKVMAFKSVGYHRTASGRKYDLQFDPAGKLAQAVLLPKGFGAGHLVLAFRAESEEEALKMLILELDSRTYF